MVHISRSHYLTLNISKTVRATDILQYSTNSDTRLTQALSFRMILNDLAKYSVTWSTRGLSATAELVVWLADVGRNQSPDRIVRFNGWTQFNRSQFLQCGLPGIFYFLSFFYFYIISIKQFFNPQWAFGIKNVTNDLNCVCWEYSCISLSPDFTWGWSPWDRQYSSFGVSADRRRVPLSGWTAHLSCSRFDDLQGGTAASSTCRRLTLTQTSPIPSSSTTSKRLVKLSDDVWSISLRIRYVKDTERRREALS